MDTPPTPTHDDRRSAFVPSSAATLRARRTDSGMTLPEVLVAMTVAGVLIAAIATAFSVMLRTTPTADDRLAESKDVTFLQAWVPVDLSTAINSWDEIDDAAIKAAMAANDPSVTYDATLEGTNVLTLLVPDADTGAIGVVAYRYAEGPGGDWRIVRYEIENPGTPAEEVRLIGVAYEVPSPPDGWVPADGVGHAVQVNARNQAAVRPVGEDLTVFFESGNEFRTGGAGLSAEQDLTPNDPVTLPDPTAPPTRCGGDIAMIIDTSGSVPAGGGGIPTEQAAVGFIDAFVGTPTRISINGFDREGYAMLTGATPAANGARAPFVSVLDSTEPGVDGMKNRILDLDDVDFNWVPAGGIDPDGNGVHYDQIGPGTNWEDGLYNIFFDSTTGQPHNANQPDLVVLITDGRPFLGRTASGGNENIGEAAAVQRAATVANDGRSQGSRLIGVMVGNQASNATAVNNLKAVVGSNEWTGQINGDGSIDVGNAVAADFFAGAWSELGAVLRSIMIAECGGTVTLRKQLDDGSVPSGRWNYSSPTGDQVLDTATQSSVTFDFNFESGETEQVVRLTEEARTGYSFVRGDCSVAGEPLDAGRVTQQPDGAAGVEVTVRPDEAVSCLMISERTS
ncbi:MAG: prepilin-type N-terminal cleavage/methylation domain-containing protein [Actinomycetota bacterium]